MCDPNFFMKALKHLLFVWSLLLYFSKNKHCPLKNQTFYILRLVSVDFPFSTNNVLERNVSWALVYAFN